MVGCHLSANQVVEIKQCRISKSRNEKKLERGSKIPAAEETLI